MRQGAPSTGNASIRMALTPVTSIVKFANGIFLAIKFADGSISSSEDIGIAGALMKIIPKRNKTMGLPDVLKMYYLDFGSQTAMKCLNSFMNYNIRAAMLF